MSSDLFSSDQVCALAGVTYRQLDSWTRTETAQPAIEARGSGSRRRWTPRQVCAVRVLGTLSDLGATSLQMREAWAFLMDRPLDHWDGVAYVDRLGRVSDTPVPGWVVDLADARRCLYLVVA